MEQEEHEEERVAEKERIIEGRMARRMFFPGTGVEAHGIAVLCPPPPMNEEGSGRSSRVFAGRAVFLVVCEDNILIGKSPRWSSS